MIKLKFKYGNSQTDLRFPCTEKEMNAALERIHAEDITPLELYVYIYLADRTNENNECWPAIPTIASDLKLSPSTVRRGIRDLKKAGLLATEQRYRKKVARAVCCSG